MTLLRIEQRAHRAGWGAKPESHPTIFHVAAHPTKHYVTARRAHRLNHELTQARRYTGGEVGEALALLADKAELGRGILTTLGLPTTSDTYHGINAGQNFYGLALRTEVWTTPDDMDTDSLRALQPGSLRLHPRRVEARLVQLVARDGLLWTVIRVRREPVQAVVTRPESDFESVGLFVNSLGRLTNAIAGNPVPIPPLTEEVSP